MQESDFQITEAAFHWYVVLIASRKSHRGFWDKYGLTCRGDFEIFSSLAE
jgi:hypothetical protein